MAATLMATLGTEPQVVTIALDLLAARGHRVSEVAVVHTDGSAEPAYTSLARLREEMERLRAGGSRLAYREVEIRDGGVPLADIENEEGAQATFRTIFAGALRVKHSGAALHLCIAGGRKTMSVYGMATAQLLFDEHDHLWHVVSFGQLLEEKRMHPEPGDRVSLVHIPVILWSHVSPVLTDLRAIEDPFEAVERQRGLRLQEQLDDARAFVLGALSGAERRVVELLAREGLPDARIAERLSVSRSTASTHLEHIYAKTRAHWGLATINRSQLVGLLSLYFTLRGETGNW